MHILDISETDLLILNELNGESSAKNPNIFI